MESVVLRGANPLEDIRNRQRIKAAVLTCRLFGRKALDKLRMKQKERQNGK